MCVCVSHHRKKELKKLSFHCSKYQREKKKQAYKTEKMRVRMMKSPFHFLLVHLLVVEQGTAQNQLKKVAETEKKENMKGQIHKKKKKR